MEPGLKSTHLTVFEMLKSDLLRLKEEEQDLANRFHTKVEWVLERRPSGWFGYFLFANWGKFSQVNVVAGKGIFDVVRRSVKGLKK